MVYEILTIVYEHYGPERCRSNARRESHVPLAIALHHVNLLEPALLQEYNRIMHSVPKTN